MGTNIIVDIFLLFVLSTVFTASLQAQSMHAVCAPILSDGCVHFIMFDPQGPQVMSLAMELAKADQSGTQKVPLKCDGQSFELSPAKLSLAKQAMQKGLPEPALAQMLHMSGQSMTMDPATDGNGSQDTRRNPQQPTAPKPVQGQTPPCSIMITPTGEMSLHLGNLELPFDQLNRLGHFMDSRMLKTMASTLRSVGFPIVQYGNYLAMHPLEDGRKQVAMRFYIENGLPLRMQVNTPHGLFEVPGQETQLNNMLADSPAMTYPIMRLLAQHGIPARFTCDQRTLTTALSRPSPPPPPQASSPPTHEESIPSRKLMTSPPQWNSLKKAVQSNEIPASRVQRLAEDRGFSVPDDVQRFLFTNIMQMRDELMPVLRGDDCIFMVDGDPFSMFGQSEDLAKVLREFEIPRELLRDSLMRVGLNTKDTPNGLEVDLPSKQTCILNNMPKKYKIFECDVATQPNNSVLVTTPPGKSYRLPEDAVDLKKAMDSGRVLPMELKDSLNKNGVPCDINMTSGHMTISLPKQHLTMPLPMTDKTGKLRLHPLEGPLGTSYVLEYEGGRLHLPSQVDKLNKLIADGTLNSYDVLHLFLQNTLLPYHFDKAKKLHVLEVAGEPLKILPSSLE